MPRPIRRLLAWLPALLVPAALACPPAPVPPTEAALQAAARHDRGLLWAVERDGHTSYLYGTLHVGRPEWVRPGPRVAAALAASDLLALEIDPSDPATQGALAADEGAPVAALPAALQRRLDRQIVAACLGDARLGALPPALQAVLLGVLEARWAGLDPAYAQEQALAQRARAGGLPVVALETVALQKQLLVPADAAAARGMVEHLLDDLESGNGRATVQRLAAAWEHGDLAALESYGQWCDCLRDADERASMRALNDERNPGLAARIDALHAEGRRVFAAVGALHMTGPLGLPLLLAARGFRVERVELVP